MEGRIYGKDRPKFWVWSLTDGVMHSESSDDDDDDDDDELVRIR